VINRLTFLIFSILIGTPFFSMAQSPETKQTGYLNITELTFARGVIHENRDLSFGFQTINGYQFTRNISAGLGVGVDKYAGKDNYGRRLSRSLTLLPVFTDLHIYLGKGKTQPFFAQALGYAFCVNQPVSYDSFGKYDEKGGILISPSIGFRTKLGNHTDLHLSFSYRYQENTVAFFPNDINQYFFPEETQFNRFDHYLTFKAGVSF
jgi:hypothetical protein